MFRSFFASSSAIKWRIILFSLMGLASLLMFINVISLLRVNTDAARYLILQDWLLLGKPATHLGAAETLPLGYPYALLLLRKVGLLNQAGILLTNFVAVAVGLWLTAKLLNKAYNATFNEIAPAMVLFCYSWVTIKHVPLPLAEPLYMLLSGISLLLLYNFSQRGNLLMLLVSLAVAYLAIKVRTVGIALAPAYLWGMWLWAEGYFNITTKQRNRWLLIALFIGMPILGLLLYIMRDQLGIMAYLSTQKSHFDVDILTFLKQNLGWHLQELGEFAINLPVSKLPIPLVYGTLLLQGIGILITALLVRFLWFRRKNLSVIEVYLMAYCLIIYNWPFYDPRFWAPILPFLMFVVTSFWNENLTLRRLTPYAVGIFVGIGLAGYLLSARLSYDKAAFANSYSPTFQPAYYLHISEADPIKRREAYLKLAQHNQRIFELLDSYDKGHAGCLKP